MRFGSYFLVLILVLGFAFASGQANASDFIDDYLSGSIIKFDLSQDEVTDTKKFEAEMDLRFRYGTLSGFVRASNDRPFTYQTDSFEIQKRGLNYELNDDWDVSIGDYSLVFGRGLALNAVEDRPVDRDAQLDGAMVKGDVGFGDLTLFWGRHGSDNPEFFVSGVNTTTDDPDDEVYGGRLAFEVGDVDIGTSYVNTDLTRWGEPLFSTVITEADIGFSIDQVDFYYETAWYTRDEPENVEESLDGRGQLADIIYADNGFSVRGSWIRYENAHFDYALPPTLKRFDIENSAANADDETGFGLDLNYSPPSWNGHSGQFIYAKTNGIEDKGHEFENYFLEWESPSTKDWIGSLSFDQVDGFQQFYGALYGTDTSYRGTLDGPFPGGGTFHLSARYRTLRTEFEDDDEVELGLDWYVTPEFTVGLFRETSTRASEPPPPGLFGIPTESPGEWNSAFVKWAADPWNEFELRLGSERGGFHCSGGTCAQLPPFKGIRFTYYHYM